MRILAITPIVVSADELARRQARYDRLAPAGVEIVLHNLADTEQAPRALDTREQIATSEALVAAQMARADVDAFDALLPDCVLDPVVGTDLAAAMPLPVHGISRLSAHHLAGSGARVSGVARNQPIADELDRKLAQYGVKTAGPTAVLNLSVEAIADDAVWTAAVTRTVRDLDVDAVLNACSAVEVAPGGPGAPGPAVVDPTATALRVLGVLAATTGEPAS